MKGVGRISAAVGAAAAAVGAAIFLLPRHGPRRRQAAADVAKRQTAHVATLVGARGDAAERLVEGVRAELTLQFGAECAGIQVTAHRATITLRGEVGRLGAIDAFEEAARSVAGVRDVNNLLRLVGPARAAL
jgi:osmotically-inducible protein OsmY